MSAQEPPQGRRFPIEAGDSRGLAASPESQDSPEAVATEHNPVRRPRATAPHRLDKELCFWGSRGPVLPAPAARRSLGDYWLSPQRRHPPGAAWRWPARNLLLLPGATGLADVPSARWPSCYGARPRLTWKHRWQNINYYFLGKRKRHLVPLHP